MKTFIGTVIVFFWGLSSGFHSLGHSKIGIILFWIGIILSLIPGFILYFIDVIGEKTCDKKSY
jgi:hypothetical protein